VTDDRDRRRFADALHPARSVSGECGSDDDADIDDRDYTPVGGPHGRRRAKTPVVDVDPSAFEPDVRWAEFDAMRAEVRLCAEDRAASKRRRKLVWGSLGISGGSLAGLLIWAVTKLDARADAAAEERLRIQTLMRLERDVRQLQLESAATQAVLGLRGLSIP
jgi:hypothetical protein